RQRNAVRHADGVSRPGAPSLRWWGFIARPRSPAVGSSLRAVQNSEVLEQAARDPVVRARGRARQSAADSRVRAGRAIHQAAGHGLEAPPWGAGRRTALGSCRPTGDVARAADDTRP